MTAKPLVNKKCDPRTHLRSGNALQEDNLRSTKMRNEITICNPIFLMQAGLRQDGVG